MDSFHPHIWINISYRHNNLKKPPKYKVATKRMGIGFFTDRNVQPTEKEVADALGPAQKNWNSCIGIVREHSTVIEEFKFCYGKKYGWAQQFRSKGKLLLSLYPNKGCFVAQIILNLQNLKGTQSLDLNKSALDAIETANEYAEGKWLFISVKDENDLEDVRSLLKIKTCVLGAK